MAFVALAEGIVVAMFANVLEFDSADHLATRPRTVRAALWLY